MAFTLSVALIAVLAGCSGTAPGTSDAPRAIEVTMTDALRFDPERITVTAGETIRFVIENPTELEHEFVIGDEREQAEHAAGMMDDDMMHGEANAIAVGPGETEELVYTFDGPAQLLIGCHVDRHYDAGMRGTIVVEE